MLLVNIIYKLLFRITAVNSTLTILDNALDATNIKLSLSETPMQLGTITAIGGANKLEYDLTNYKGLYLLFYSTVGGNNFHTDFYIPAQILRDRPAVDPHLKCMKSYGNGGDFTSDFVFYVSATSCYVSSFVGSNNVFGGVLVYGIR